ncbi:PEP-CTERM motif protein [Opitutaceae bacterium TAV1]|nr:PEP-CTERM motif protein [Opitutaceae bacterium TAV1]
MQGMKSLTMPFRLFPLSFAAGLALATAGARATVYLEETFSGYVAGSLGGQGASSASAGLSGNWERNAVTDTYVDVQSASLAFGDLANEGGSLRLYGTAANKSVVIGARVDASLASTVYSAFVFRFDTLSTSNATSFSGIRMSSTQDGSSDTRFAVSPDGSASLGGTPDARFNGSVGSSGWGTLLASETYIALSRYERVGDTLSASAKGKLTTWYLTLDQFNAYKADNFATLNAATAADVAAKTYSESSSGTSTITGSYLQFVVFNASGETGLIDVTFDALRFGDSFDAVTPLSIPEPATWAVLIGAAAFGIAVMLRKRSRR